MSVIWHEIERDAKKSHSRQRRAAVCGVGILAVLAACVWLAWWLL